ncbi:MAG: response regulator [Bacteroidota bacterium]
MNILIVEDEWVVSEEVKECIQAWYKSSKVWQVDNGKEALYIFDSQSIEIAIIDIKIRGDLDGIELANKVQALNKDCRLIFISSYFNSETMEKITQFKNYSFFHKPINTFELSAALVT